MNLDKIKFMNHFQYKTLEDYLKAFLNYKIDDGFLSSSAIDIMLDGYLKENKHNHHHLFLYRYNEFYKKENEGYSKLEIVPKYRNLQSIIRCDVLHENGKRECFVRIPENVLTEVVSEIPDYETYILLNSISELSRLILNNDVYYEYLAFERQESLQQLVNSKLQELGYNITVNKLYSLISITQLKILYNEFRKTWIDYVLEELKIESISNLLNLNILDIPNSNHDHFWVNMEEQDKFVSVFYQLENLERPSAYNPPNSIESRTDLKLISSIRANTNLPFFSAIQTEISLPRLIEGLIEDVNCFAKGRKIVFVISQKFMNHLNSPESNSRTFFNILSSYYSNDENKKNIILCSVMDDCKYSAPIKWSNESIIDLNSDKEHGYTSLIQRIYGVKIIE